MILNKGNMNKSQRSQLIVILLLILLPIAFFISLNAGYTDLSVKDVIRIISGYGSKKENIIILDFRMPRILLSMLCGCGFALAGCVLQAVTKNPLADTGIMGINAGAGLVTICFVAFQGKMSIFSQVALPALSLIGGTITGILIYALSIKKGRGVQPIRIVLNGVAIQAGVNSIMTLVVLTLDERERDFLVSFQSGSVWNASWQSVSTLIPWILIGIIILLSKARTIDALSMGDEIATGLGVKVAKSKRLLLFTAIGIASACVSASGSISFVGLIAPHMSRRLVGNKHEYLIPTCGVLGGFLVLLGDTIGRVIIEPSEIPAGIVVSIIGVPYFLYLLIRSRKTN